MLIVECMGHWVRRQEKRDMGHEADGIRHEADGSGQEAGYRSHEADGRGQRSTFVYCYLWHVVQTWLNLQNIETDGADDSHIHQLMVAETGGPVESRVGPWGRILVGMVLRPFQTKKNAT